jgi:hypothetical protein
MRRFYGKMVLWLLLAGFCIMFGVSMAQAGLERIGGPMDGQQSAAVSASAQDGAVKRSTGSAGQRGQTGTSATGRVDSQSIGSSRSNGYSSQGIKRQGTQQNSLNQTNGINEVGAATHSTSLSSKIGGALQIAAQLCIKLVVSIFDGIF